MKRVLSWIVMVPFAVVVIVFSAVNRGLVPLDLWPFPVEISVPVFTLVLCIFIFGFLFGGVVAWVSAGDLRRRARNHQWRADNAERELRDVKNKLHERDRENTDEQQRLPAILPGA